METPRAGRGGARRSTWSRGGPRPDRGEGAVSYLAVIILVAAVTAAIATSGLGRAVTGGIGRAVCQVTQSSCGDGADDAAPAPGRQGTSRPAATSPPAREEDRPEYPLPPHPPTGTTIPEDPAGGGRTTEEHQDDLAEYQRRYDRLVRSVLAQSATGREVLEYLEDHPIPIEYVPGEGSSTDGESIQIDSGPDRTLEQIAVSLVHETTHHRDRIRDGVPSPGDFDERDDYFTAMAEFETRATVRAIEAVQELEVSRGYRGPGPGSQVDYEAAYRQGERRERRRNPDATAAELERAGQRAGFNRLRDNYLDGTTTRSTDGDTYIDEWEDRWNRTHGSWSCRNLGVGC